MKLLYLFVFWLGLLPSQAQRIITLSGPLTETVDALGLGSKIVATDVTSLYPAYVRKLPKVSRNRTVSAESLLSFTPDIILAPEGLLSPALLSQLKAVGVRVVIISQRYSVPGALAFVASVGKALQQPTDPLPQELHQRITRALQQRKLATPRPKVLFIYARGLGHLLVAGRQTNLDAMIELAGAQNAASRLSGYKAYTTEALIAANPDVILLFDFGYESLGGKESILRMPGMALTNAGKNHRILAMDGELLINFSVRLDQAITQLNTQLNALFL